MNIPDGYRKVRPKEKCKPGDKYLNLLHYGKGKVVWTEVDEEDIALAGEHFELLIRKDKSKVNSKGNSQ